MPTVHSSLAPLLRAGSSRVFNCNEIATRLLAARDPDPYFFQTPGMNFLLIFKEAILDDRERDSRAEKIVGTKLFFPYDRGAIAQGGRSINVHHEKLPRIIREHLGVGGDFSGDALSKDVAMLEILDRLPSLDGFLIRDALEIAGHKVNPKYFDLPEAEQAKIRGFIRKKFDPLVRQALNGGQVPIAKANELAGKIWDANDPEALAPLIHALRFPPDEALAIFSAWKGIIFYSFRYLLAKVERESFAKWLRDRARPRSYVTKYVQQELETNRAGVVSLFRHHWQIVDQITRDHDRVYGELLKSPEGAPSFVEFLRGSRDLYWQMGTSLSQIDFATALWRRAVTSFGESLPATQLEQLLIDLNRVLAIDAASGNTEVAREYEWA